ncbi:MAG TPA: hypothetical protein VFQ61_19125 [Polyangiaceae bacterium]|nr:hypothetical protein [Polyangiaceae bacterium]
MSSTFGLRSSELDRYWKLDTYEAGLSMVMTARDEILGRYGQSGKTIFVVGHASAGQVMIGLLQGRGGGSYPTTRQLDAAGV